MSVYYYFYIFKDTFSNPTGLLAFLLLPFFIFITFLFLALGVFQALIAYKLLQGRNWARITQIVILIIDFLLSVLNLASFYFEKELELQQSIQVVPIIIPLIILWFLIFDKTTKEYFKKNTN